MYDDARRATADHKHIHAQNKFAVIPTPERLKADGRFTGRGVRIAFLDSGFVPHPDIAKRIVEYSDVSGEEPRLDPLSGAKPHHWHGTQTTVSCAGDGSLSDGIYRGIASEAELVLVKVSQNGRISDKAIEKGLRWVLANRERLGIRILNMSLGGDCDVTTAESTINQLAEELVRAGVVVTAAAGNSEERRPIPPAASPSVITVGGYSDRNRLSRDGLELYHSSFGRTADGVVKPEIIAPAMYVAAPILPGTPDYDAAEMLSILSGVPDYGFRPLLEEFWSVAGLAENILNLDDGAARKLVEYALHQRKVVSHHYQHVDGTSFAAPIAASVAAQMLEASPRLTPAAVKNILIATALRVAGNPAIRQGYGMINAPEAVKAALNEKHMPASHQFSPPRVEGAKILFSYHDDRAESVRLAGDFNGWDPADLRRDTDGFWRFELPCIPAGRYRYKFLVNGEKWLDDPSHGFKEDDGFGGFNSELQIVE